MQNRPVALLVLGALLLGGCLASAKPVRMPDGSSALRIECNYTLDNCKREARAECDGNYELVTQGDLSCRDCGWDADMQHAQRSPVETQLPVTEGNNVYTGVLYVRCK